MKDTCQYNISHFYFTILFSIKAQLPCPPPPNLDIRNNCSSHLVVNSNDDVTREEGHQLGKEGAWIVSMAK